MNETLTPQTPDESQFKSMETIASASGPEAEARRKEMAQWSEAQGKLAESQALTAKQTEGVALIDGTHEQVADLLAGNAKATARATNITLGEGERSHTVTAKASEKGVKISDATGTRTLRSPARINDKLEDADYERI